MPLMDDFIEEMEDDVEFCLERLMIDLINQISARMEEAGVSRADLARQSGKKTSQLTKLLNQGQNPTLKTLMEICIALDLRPEIYLAKKVGHDCYAGTKRVTLDSTLERYHFGGFEEPLQFSFLSGQAGAFEHCEFDIADTDDMTVSMVASEGFLAGAKTNDMNLGRLQATLSEASNREVKKPGLGTAA